MAVRFVFGSIFTASVFVFALIYWLKQNNPRNRRRVIQKKIDPKPPEGRG